MNRYLCSVWPYFDRATWGVGRALHAAGYKGNPSSYKIAWGFGHPTFTMEDSINEGLERTYSLRCTRCGEGSKV